MRAGHGKLYYVCLSCLFIECFHDVAGLSDNQTMNGKDFFTINSPDYELESLNVGVPATTVKRKLVTEHRSRREKEFTENDQSTIEEKEIQEALEQLLGRKIYTSANDNVTTDVSSTNDVTENTSDKEDTETNEKESSTTSATTVETTDLTTTSSAAETTDLTTTSSAPETSVLTTVTEETTDMTEDDMSKYREHTTVASTETLKPDNLRTNKNHSLPIEVILDIIGNLTHEYDTNLTLEINRTLLSMYSIPTCATPAKQEISKVSIPYPELNISGPVIAKCFVCGMDIGEIPRTAHCADAFAGDFVPLVPMDPTARGQIANFRKYCRYADVDNFRFSEEDRRSAFGRWTGGCSVRWVDLSGVYTQRTCRNRHRATLGHHYVSKRMARLEMALRHMDSGCIVSPMATLVPFSRGISLYARFHACVCMGNWCNTAALHHPWITTFGITVVNLYSSS